MRRGAGRRACERGSLPGRVVHPAPGDPLPDGEVGELVFTTLTKEALPLLRYRTGDLALLTREPCACGRTFARMSRVLGRTDDMLIIRGVNVFPSEIERALLAIPELEPHYQLLVDRPGHLDELTVQVEGTVDAGPCASSSITPSDSRLASRSSRPGASRAARGRPCASSIAARRNRGDGPRVEALG